MIMGLYYEEFSVDQMFDHQFTRTVTEYDNMSFSLLTMNPQPLHIDFDFASKSEWGKPLVNSLFTLGLMIGMTVADTTLGTTVGNLGMSDTRFPLPVFHGDTLKAHTKVVSLRESKSNPKVGIVEFEHHMTNQRGETVAICRRAAMMHKKPGAQS
jgi:acyl dehydratase